MNKTWHVPVTPGGTFVMHLKARTEGEAWTNLLRDAAHMPYKTKENFIKRGYTVVELKPQNG